MHFIAILLGAWALCEVLAAPTHLDVEMTLRIEDRILSHRPLPLKNSMTTYRLDDFSSFYIADVIGDPKHIAIIDTELSTDGCAKKIDLPSDDYCGKTFSFAGVDDLHLEGCDLDFPMLIRGDAEFGLCTGVLPGALSCSGFSIEPLYRCFLGPTDEARWAKGAFDVEMALRVEDNILSHQALPSKNSVTAHRLTDFSTFYIADVIGDPKHIAIIDTELSTDGCAKKIDLPSDDYCRKTFSFAGVDDLHLEECDRDYPLLFRGDAQYGGCGSPPPIILSCPDFLIAPRFRCFLPSTGEARWAKGISNVETAFRVEDHILSHQALPSKNSITASSFFIADFKDPEHVAIIDTDLSTNVCAKIDLLPKDFYSKTFSFAGVDGLSLEGPGLTYPLVLRGTAGYRECSAPPSFTINCPGNDYRPRFTCPLK